MESIKALSKDEFPPELLEIPEPPKTLYYRGTLPDFDKYILLCVVGSRKITPYGKMAIEKIISGLSGHNIIIVSGLALGTDTLAHEHALKAGLKTIAVPGSGLSNKVLYPATNINLTKRILEKGGLLLSELEENQGAAPWTFPRRNRIMAGLSKAILVVEAERPSGTLITSRLATEYNRDVLAVPGSIFSSFSEGPNFLISQGAKPITSAEDVLSALNLDTKNADKDTDQLDLSPNERNIMNILLEPKSRDEIINTLNLSASDIQESLSSLEINGLIKEQGGKIYRTQ